MPADRLREAGMALEAVQAQAGHRSLESTRVDLHLTNDWLADQYSAGNVTRRHIAPRDIGARRIDHFAFFRPDAKETLWHYAATWLAAQIP